MLIITDHTDPVWSKAYNAKARENGAATYSRDIVKYHLPLWEEWAGDRTVHISTCPPLRAQSEAEITVQYLHEYRYENPLRLPRAIQAAAQPRRMIFVVAYKALADQMNRAGMETLFVPMAVDVKRIQETPTEDYRRYTRRAAYFGNVTRPKKALYASLSAELASRGWSLDHVLETPSEAAWARLRAYQYGVGVGRCALEMGALGMKVLICGAQFGGLMASGLDILTQRGTNMNGRIVTYDRNMGACIDNWGDAVPGVTTDIPVALARLREGLDGT